MKKLPITSPHYNYILKSFREWLDVLGYAPTTVYSMPHYVREFLHYLEQQGNHQINQIENKHIKQYYRELKQRSNTRKGGGLSNSYLNKHIQALQKFSDYLRQSGRLQIPKLHITTEEEDHQIKYVLTQEEIHQLYEAAAQYAPPKERVAPWANEALALRDKAMLSIFYGCGLRRNEAVHLDISDIHADKKYIYVRKGKNYKERIVPINQAGLTHIQNYLYESRPRFLRNEKEEALFIGSRGTRLGGQAMLLRLKLLIQKVDNTELQHKEISLHTLRHSIATHLLQNGMQLEAIAKFLGHSSLESTQIYTHLVAQEHEESGANIFGTIE
jgi:integrase/recombinase XerD